MATRVVIVSGLFVARDAISGAVTAKLKALDSINYEVDVFCHFTDRHADNVHVVDSLSTMVTHPRFRSADVYCYEFGIWYELFDANFLTAKRAPAIVNYHNVTPIELVPDELVPTIERSLEQRYNLFEASHILNDSAFNQESLLDIGIPESQMEVLYLPPAVTSDATSSPERSSAPVTRSEPVRLLFVGRIVPSKGVTDLVNSFASAGARAELTIAGSVAASDPETVAQVVKAADWCDYPVRVLDSPRDDVLAELYRKADCLVIPSYHEGYCVPIVEAFSAGCEVIGYRGSTIPETLGGLGRTVSPGDTDTLAAEIASLVTHVEAGGSVVATDRGDLSRPEWLQRVQALLDSRSQDCYSKRFGEVVNRACA